MRPFLTRKNARNLASQSRKPLVIDLEENVNKKDPDGEQGSMRLSLPRRARQMNYSAGEIATARTMLAKLRRGEDVREQRVIDARAAFMSGMYDEAVVSGLKLDVAMDRMLDDVLSDEMERHAP